MPNEKQNQAVFSSCLFRMLSNWKEQIILFLYFIFTYALKLLSKKFIDFTETME